MTLLNSVLIACYLHILLLKGGEKEYGTSIPLEEPSTLEVDGWDGSDRPVNGKRYIILRDGNKIKSRDRLL